MPEPEETPVRTMERAAETVTRSLAQVREELADKRAQRAVLNDEIRLLVADEDLLRRMARLVAPSATNGDQA